MLLANLADIATVLAFLLAILVWPGRLATHFFRHVITDVVNETVKPYLVNGERTVANYAHDAADSAKTAAESAQAARDAAYDAKVASLETRDIVMSMRDGR